VWLPASVEHAAARIARASASDTVAAHRPRLASRLGTPRPRGLHGPGESRVFLLQAFYVDPLAVDNISFTEALRVTIGDKNP
jgi:hypothetical protein